MPLSTITATLDNTIRCTFNEFCSQQQSNITQDASISFTTLLTASSTLMATIYAAASSSLTLSSIKLYSFYSKQRLLNQYQFIQSNSTFNTNLDQSTANHNTSPTQSEIVSITGALIVFTFLLTTVLLTHLFDAIDDFTRKCWRSKSNLNLTNLWQIGIGKQLRQLICFFNQLVLDLLITIILKSSILTSLFVDEKSLNLNKKLNLMNDHYERRDGEEIDSLEEFVDHQLENEDNEDESLDKQTKWSNWSSWFAAQLRKRSLAN